MTSSSISTVAVFIVTLLIHAESASRYIIQSLPTFYLKNQYFIGLRLIVLIFIVCLYICQVASTRSVASKVAIYGLRVMLASVQPLKVGGVPLSALPKKQQVNLPA